jgi:hypothetical protein
MSTVGRLKHVVNLDAFFIGKKMQNQMETSILTANTAFSSIFSGLLELTEYCVHLSSSFSHRICIPHANVLSIQQCLRFIL